jgi:hypothetical protein
MEGPSQHRKVRQLNKLMSDYGIDVLTCCKTRTDWQFVTNEEDRFCNLFGNGQPIQGSHSFNTNDQKIKRDQLGGICITAARQFSSFVKEVGTDSSKLGCWSWVYAGGGSKLTRIIVAYQPCGTRKRKMMGEAVWDQHLQYFKARGEIRNPRVMFQYNLISPLCWWKAAGDKILLMGDFNKNVYSGPVAVALSENESRLSKICHRTTGETLPPTHACSRTPIDAMFGTMGLVCTAASLLLARAGVGNHQVFVADFTSALILRDVFPQVIRFTGQLLNCALDEIKNNCIALLNQLSNRHLIFKKLLWIDNASDHISLAKVQLRMNRVDLELE